ASAPSSPLGAAMRESVGAPDEEPAPDDVEPPTETLVAAPEPEPEPEPRPRPSKPAAKLDLDTSDCPPDFPGCESFEDRLAEEEADAAARRFPRHWISVGYQQDFLLMDATSSACTGNAYQCYDGQGGYRDPASMGVVDPVTGLSSGAGEIGSGLAMATSRVLLGYDFGILPELL